VSEAVWLLTVRLEVRVSVLPPPELPVRVILPVLTVKLLTEVGVAPGTIVKLEYDVKTISVALDEVYKPILLYKDASI
jgi:hypothetical protein